MKPAALLVLACLATLALADSERREPPRTEPTPEITADEWLSRAAYFASDELAGRESGTAGGRMAEEYVAAEFKRLGLHPLGAEGSFFQDVPLPTRNPDPDNTWVALAGAGDAEQRQLGDATDCVPFAFSALGEASGELAFAGFGLTDTDSGYDDYLGLDAKGKVLLILRHGPGEDDPKSVTSPRGPRARQMMALQSFTAKASRAAAAGAAAVLLVNDYHHEKDGLPVTVRGKEAQIPVLAVSRTVAEELLAGTGPTLRELQEAIDGDRAPRSSVFEGRTVTVSASLHSSTGRNVVALLRGSDPELRDEVVVLGAHIDHVGMGYFGSPAGGGQVHNGADDNASGAAAMLEAAEWLATQKAPRRSILIAGWCGEEKGLVGSRHFADHPLVPIEQTVACVNLDMVGRYRTEGPKDGGLYVGGAPTGQGLVELVDRITGAAEVVTTHSWNAWEQSDHYAFYAKGVPSLFLTTGLHAEYHRPADDWWLLNAPGAARVTDVAVRLTTELANGAGRPEFVERPPRPVLGVRLGDDPKRDGALMALVVPNMSAAKAGMLSGDLVTAWDGQPVTSAEALGVLIGKGKVGDVVKVTIVRGIEELVLDITLSARPKR